MDTEERLPSGRDRTLSGSSSGSDKSDDVLPHTTPNNERVEKNGAKDEKRRRSASRSDDDNKHRSHRHSGRSSHHHRRRRRSSRESRRRRSSGEHKSESGRKRSRSRDRSHQRNSRSSREGRSHGSSRRRRSRSPRRRLKSPRCKSNLSPPPGYDRAMDAQEKLARRLEKARQLMRRKEEMSKKEKDEEMRKNSSPFDRVQEVVKKANQIVSDSTVNVCHDGMSAQAKAHVEALRAKVLAETGVELPSYYNPLAINPLNYAQQAAKRKKLWAKKDDVEGEDTKSNTTSVGKTALWSGVKFGDNKSNEKFAKLMGIKSNQQAKGNTSKEANEIIKKQAEVFQNLDMQYQQARLATHTQRGLGLGFSSTLIDPNAGQSQAGSTSNG